MSPPRPPPFRSLAEEMSTTKSKGEEEKGLYWLDFMHNARNDDSNLSLSLGVVSHVGGGDRRELRRWRRKRKTSELQCWLRRFSTWYPSSIYSLVTHLASCGCFLEKIVTDSPKMRPLHLLVAMAASFIYHLQKWLGALLSCMQRPASASEKNKTTRLLKQEQLMPLRNKNQGREEMWLG